MTPDQFWQTGMDTFVVYLNAHNYIEERKYKDQDILAWSIGTYVINALRNQPIMAYGMTAGKDIKKISEQYPEKPISILNEEKEKRIKEQRVEKIKADKPSDEQIRAYQQLIAEAKAKRRKEE